jgi:DNA-binding transcriptional LysR family regulator
MPGHLERIEIFVEVATRGGFAVAARALGLSPQAVTRAVADLEAGLGVQLLTRTTRSVALTRAGEGYLDEVRAALRALGRAEDEARAAQNTLTGPLRVSAPLSFGLRFLPDVVQGFRLLHPRIVLTLDLSDRFVDILGGDHDMALRISGPPEGVSLIWRKICAVPRVLVASPGYLDRSGLPGEPGDLTGHDMLAYGNDPAGETLRLTRGGTTETLTPRPALSADSGDLLAALALRGEGIALLPRFLVSDALRDGRLAEVLPGWDAPEVWLTASYPPYDRLPAKVAAFTAFVEARVAEAPDLLR